MFSFLKRLFGRKLTPADMPAKGFYGSIPPRPMPAPFPPVPSPGFIKAEQSRQKRIEDEAFFARVRASQYAPIPVPRRTSDERRTVYAPVPPPAYDSSNDLLNPANVLSPFNPIHSFTPMASADPVTHYDPPPAPAPSYECPAPSPSYDSPACSPPPMDFGSSSGTDSAGW